MDPFRCRLGGAWTYELVLWAVVNSEEGTECTHHGGRDRPLPLPPPRQVARPLQAGRKAHVRAGDVAAGAEPSSRRERNDVVFGELGTRRRLVGAGPGLVR